MTAQASNDSSISTKLTGERNNNLLANIPQSISSDGQLNNKPLVFVLMGQSNACGAADIQDSQDYLTQHPNIRKYIQSTSNSGEKFTQTLVPFCEQWKDNSDGKVSLMNSFLERMVEQFPNQKFDVLNCSIPGSSIQSYEKGKVVDMNFYGNDFQTGDRNIYEHCVRRTQEVLEQGGGTLAGVLFHQGETDNAASYWKPAVENLVLNFRQDLNSNVPFIFGHLAPVPQYENHNQIIDSLENTSNLIGVVSSQGLSYQSDNIHFDQQGSLGLGYRYAEKMLEFLRDEEEVSKTRAKNNNFLISSSKHKAKNQQAGLHI
ncbi:MAG: sialate O-acetylesterase [Cyanobacteria bacterium P01_A01_bin.83]